jgi:hypothetical protein
MDGVETRWPSHLKGFLTHFGSVIVFRGNRNANTLQTIQTVVGKERIKRQSLTQNRAQGPNGGSTSIQSSEELFDKLDTGHISAGRSGFGDMTDDPTRFLLLRQNGHDMAWATPYYATSPFTEHLVEVMEKRACTSYEVGLAIPNLDRDGTGDNLRALGGEHLVDRFRTARDRLQRKAVA